MNFFRTKKQQEALDPTFGDKLVEQQVAPGTQLHYDGELIGRLRSHHNTLLDLLTRASETAQAAKFDETGKCVSKFRRLLSAHLLEKNLRLYTYLSCCLKADPAGLELTRNTRRETSGISRQATLFITRYSDAGINEENRTAFLAELAQIKNELDASFAREERSLYTMYQPPQAYAGNAEQPAPANTAPESPVSLVMPQPMASRQPTNLDDVLLLSPRDFAPRLRAAG